MLIITKVELINFWNYIVMLQTEHFLSYFRFLFLLELCASKCYKCFKELQLFMRHTPRDFFIFFNYLIFLLCEKKNLWPLFYGWGSTISRLQSNYEETVNFLPLSCQQFLVLILKGSIDLGATQWFWTGEPWIGNPVAAFKLTEWLYLRKYICNGMIKYTQKIYTI